MMIIKELQLLSEALWENVKNNLTFFSPIKSFTRRLAEFDFTELNEESIKELKLYVNKIDEFFESYRPGPGIGSVPPRLAELNDDTVIRIVELVNSLNQYSVDELKREAESIKPKSHLKAKGKGYIFIGHGRSKLWSRLQVFIKDELNLNTLYFESESRTSESITSILEEFLNKTSLAILVFTAEDETIEGKVRARQNVIHEAGLFQGRLGFDKVIILKQEGLEEFSNVSGLQYIPFSEDNIEQTFYELQRKLKKSGLLK